MRKFKTQHMGTVDLDDPSIYEYLPKSEKELERLMFCEIGKALTYMDFLDSRKGLFPKRKKKDKFVKLSEFFPNSKNGDKLIEVNNASYNQRMRIYKLIREFSNNRHNNYGNTMWLKEQIFLFQEETENMC